MAYNNPFMSYQQPIQNPYMTGYPQQQPVQQTPVYYGLRGEVVDSVDVVKAKNVDMSGNPVFYPRADMNEIYVKQLQADGSSRIEVYQRTSPQAQDMVIPSGDKISEEIKNLRNDFAKEIEELKAIILKEGKGEKK